MVGVYRIQFSEHECLESQQPEKCSITCVSLPVPVKFYQRDLIFTYLSGIETVIVFVDFLDLCAWIKSLIKTIGVFSKLEVQIQAFFSFRFPWIWDSVVVCPFFIREEILTFYSSVIGEEENTLF